MHGKEKVMKKLLNVPYIDQTNDWPTGCESVSTVMLLKYLGVQISMEEFVDIYLPKCDFKEIDGELYGANPNKEFAGNPKDTESFGCYAPVIENTLNKIFKEKNIGYEAINITGLDTEVILKEYIDNDIPVVYWASIDLKPTIVGPEWKLIENGETFTWISNEHCMLLVGYDEDKLYFNDPWHNHGTIGYDKELVIKRHKEQYQMAVGIKRLV